MLDMSSKDGTPPANMDMDATSRPNATTPGRPAVTPPSNKTKRSFPSEDEEDPLSSDPVRFGHPSQQPSLHNTPSRKGTASGKPQIAVYLQKSSHNNVSSGPLVKTIDGSPPVMSDLRRKTDTSVTAPARAEESTDAAAAAPIPVVSSGRGRPKGWKPGMKYSTMRGHAPKSGTTQAKPKSEGPGVIKRRGRPPKKPSPPPEAVYRGLKAEFLAYLCEWSGCKAELHNLDTLRKHVYLVHGKGEKCLWGACTARDIPREFLKREDFEAHMEEEHLVPMGWHVGDGPSNDMKMATKRKDDGIPDFLRDTNGQQVTPSVRDQEVEDHATWKANRRKLAELLKQRDENLPSDESDKPDGSLP